LLRSGIPDNDDAAAVVAFVRSRPNASSRLYTAAFERVEGNKHACVLLLLLQFRNQTPSRTSGTDRHYHHLAMLLLSPAPRPRFSISIAVALVRSTVPKIQPI
jgi:hypothetical protein